MQKPKNRIATIAIALCLMLSMAASMMLVPNANAHTPAWNVPTFAYIQAVPNPIGVGQSGYIFMWVDKIPDGAELGNDIRFHNYQLTITAPDGTTQTQTFAVVSDPTSNQAYSFTPTQVGTYTLKFTFPGQLYTYTGLIPGLFGPPAPSAYVNDTYMPSTASTTLTVQQTPIATYPTTPLPTEYWTRPIYGENPNWYTISSNWLGSVSATNQGYGSNFPGDAVGPQTSHVMWTKPLQSGGVVGGNNFAIPGATYFEGSAYNNRYTNPIILDGMLYYTEPISFAGATSGPTDCVNLQTGQLIWSRTDVPALAFGYIYDVEDPNQHGVYPPMLVASTGGGLFSFGPATWRVFDADTGDPLFNVTNVPQGPSAMGVNGEYLIYVLANDGTPTQPNYYLAQWNSSRLWDNTYSGPSTSPPIVPPITNGNDPSLYDWNISIPSLNTKTTTSSILAAFRNNMLICMSGSYPSGPSLFGAGSWSPYTYFAINLNPTKGAIGSVPWSNTVNAPAGNITVSFTGADPTAGVFTEAYKETMQYVGYSMNTGQKIWGPIGNQTALNYYNSGYNAGGNEAGAAVAYGNLYSAGFGGILYCYDLTNGNTLWTYGNGGKGNSTSSGFEVPGPYPTSIYAIGNGIVYTTTTEHTVQTPIYKGALARAVNATTGQEIWTLSAFTGESGPPNTGAIADGFATFYNGYDNQIYVVGRGPSATTIEASPKVTTHGNSVLIEGTVTDISAGTQQTEQKADFPNGVPVASDASMTDWMSYVYQQQPHPTNFTGVPVTLTALDPNGNTENIGTVTSDITGGYAIAWTPPVPGLYTITATFGGTNSYWGSSTETHIVVAAAAAPAASASPQASATPTPTTTPTQTATPSPQVTATPVPAPSSPGIPTTYMIIAVVAIIIVVAAAALFLRRRK